MKKNLFVVLALLCIASISFSQKENKNVFKKGTDEYKMFMARQDFYGGDYRSALNKYKEVEKNRPNDGVVHFYIGECYYMMKTYQDAVDELEKAKSLDVNASAELPLFLGKAYHAKAMLDKALDELNAYRKTIADNPKKIEESEVDVEISQCNVAKQLMANPVTVKLIQLVDLNSQYDDKKPVLINNDKTMIFTSRRPEGDKSRVDKEGDYGFFDNVYESYWDDQKKTWAAADLIRGPINSDGGYTAVTSISPDGSMMFLYKNDGSQARGGEIFISKKSTSGKWRTPEILLKPINTSYFEDGAVLSPDGNTLYFVSERPGGLGNGDIWTSKKAGDGWSEPVNLGSPVNSAYDEENPWLTPDGKTLFFSSNGPNSMGFHDIFRTTMGANGKWTTPVNVGYPINSVGLETKFILTADKKTAYLSTARDSGIGEQDIMQVDISNYNVMTGINIPQTATLMGKVTSSDSVHTALSVEIRILEKGTGNQVAMTKSGSDGSYSVDFPANKHLVMEIDSEGFQKMSQEISLSTGKTESKNITLIKK